MLCFGALAFGGCEYACDRSGRGLSGRRRPRSQIVDRNKNKKLDPEEFEQACRINNLGLNNAEMNVLFRAFDKDGDGSVGYEEFLRAVRGRLSATRKTLVKKIFDVLDKYACAPFATLSPLMHATLSTRVTLPRPATSLP